MVRGKDYFERFLRMKREMLNPTKTLMHHRDLGLFIRYVIFAGLAALVDLGLLYLFTEFLDLWYLYSAALSYFMGMVTNYSLNKYLNFKNRSKKIIPQFGLFIAIALVGLGLNQIILYTLVRFADLWYMSAKVITLLLVMFWSFYGHKRFTFRVFK